VTTQKRRPPDVPLTKRAAPGNPMDQTTEPVPDATLGREIQAKIGLQLRTLYNDIVSEGVPDRFVDLLGKLNGGKSDRGSQE
jgi:hypothetical protein